MKYVCRACQASGPCILEQKAGLPKPDSCVHHWFKIKADWQPDPPPAEGEIEALRNLFRNHEKRIAKLEHYSPQFLNGANNLTIDMATQRDRLATLRRKVEELEKQHAVLENIVHQAINKPQPRRQAKPEVTHDSL